MSAILLTLCEPHILEALSTSFSQITPGSYILLSLSPYCPYIPPALHFCSCFLGIGQSERSPMRTLAWYRISAETYPRCWAVNLAGHPASQRTESSHLTLGGAPGKERCLSMVFQRQQVGRWKSEDKREENLWESAVVSLRWWELWPLAASTMKSTLE